MPLQKVFLLPPLKGLNLYDNPFTMSPDFAVELKNFMPPTTTLTVRPGVKFIIEIDGQVRGLYSYTTGSTINYGQHWYNSNIEYGSAQTLLIKSVGTKGYTMLSALDTTSSSFSLTEVAENLPNSNYNDDSALYRHTMFFLSGATDSIGFLYHQNVGVGNFALQLGDDGQHEIGNMQCITIYKNFLFMSSPKSLNIYYIAAQYADSLDPQNSVFWKSVENLFSPHHASTFTLDGLVQNGGSIIKLCNMSRGGSDTISTYLMAITDMGEIILFDGTDPSKGADGKWSVAGRFQIAPPLNRWAMCEMDGDYIVVTKNGLISLRRVLFGQSSQITENLEYRLLSLFSQYMFKIPSVSNFISLNYHPRNRLLIFNVPTVVPIPFNQLQPSYVFNDTTQIIFKKFSQIDDTSLNLIKAFIEKYLYFNYINFTFLIEFDGDYNKYNITLNFATSVDPTNNSSRTIINFSYKNGSSDASDILEHPLVYTCNNIYSAIPTVTLVTPPSDCKWNSKLITGKGEDSIYSLNFSVAKGKELIVTNIASKTSFFAQSLSLFTLATSTPNSSIGHHGMIGFYKYMIKPLTNSNLQRMSLETFYNRNDFARSVTQLLTGDSYNSSQKISFFIGSTNSISPVKALIWWGTCFYDEIFEFVKHSSAIPGTNVIPLSRDMMFSLEFSFDSFKGKVKGQVFTVINFDMWRDSGSPHITTSIQHSVNLTDISNNSLGNYAVDYNVTATDKRNDQGHPTEVSLKVADDTVSVRYSSNNDTLASFLLTSADKFDSISGGWITNFNDKGESITAKWDLSKDRLLAFFKNNSGISSTINNADWDHYKYFLSNLIFSEKIPGLLKDYVPVSELQTDLIYEGYTKMKNTDYYYNLYKNNRSINMYVLYKSSDFGVLTISQNNPDVDIYFNGDKDKLCPLRAILKALIVPTKNLKICTDDSLNFTFSADLKTTLNINSQDFSPRVNIRIIGYGRTDTVSAKIEVQFTFVYPMVVYEVRYIVSINVEPVDNTYFYIASQFDDFYVSSGNLNTEIDLPANDFLFSYKTFTGFGTPLSPSSIAPTDFKNQFLAELYKVMPPISDSFGWENTYSFLCANTFFSEKGKYPPAPDVPPTPDPFVPINPPDPDTYDSIGNFYLNIPPAISGVRRVMTVDYFCDMKFTPTSQKASYAIDNILNMGVGSYGDTNIPPKLYFDTESNMFNPHAAIIRTLRDNLQSVPLTIDSSQTFYGEIDVWLCYTDDLDKPFIPLKLEMSLNMQHVAISKNFTAELSIIQKIADCNIAMTSYTYSLDLSSTPIYAYPGTVSLKNSSKYNNYCNSSVSSVKHLILSAPYPPRSAIWTIQDQTSTWGNGVRSSLNDYFTQRDSSCWKKGGLSWMFNNVLIRYTETDSTLVSSNPKPEPSKPLPEVAKEVAKEGAKEISLNANSSSSLITNIDMSTIPLFGLMEIVCNFKSTQYVFDSHFGTWSSFEDINMVKGIEHANEFYFVIPNDFTYDEKSSSYLYSSSRLCKFEVDQLLGDEVLPKTEGTTTEMERKPINVGYKTVPTFDFGIPQKKLFKRIKVFGTSTAFWQINIDKTVDKTITPFIITPFSDFKEGITTGFIHAYDGVPVSQRILQRHFRTKSFHELSFSENKKFWELYKAEIDMLAQITIPMIANPGTRFGLKLDMDIREAYVDIYGFEIFFEVANQIL
jgi:hypothetical protein